MKRVFNFLVVVSVCICCFMLVGSDCTVVFAEEETQSIEATFYLLKRGYSRPVYEGTLPASRYMEIGKGSINTPERTTNNDTLVEERLDSTPDVSDYIHSDEKVVWYAIKKENDGWHVDGCIVTNEDENTKIDKTECQEEDEIEAKYFLLKKGIKRPIYEGTLSASSYVYLGEGNIVKEGKVVNNEEVVAKRIGEIPDASQWISSKETIVWYTIKNENDGWHVDGCIVPKYETYASVEDMKKADIEEGTYIQTLGYYEAKDGGDGVYKIEKDSGIKDNGGTILQLNNGLTANLVAEDQFVSIKQFGAKSDCDFDNSEVFNRAFSSGVTNLEFPKGEYKVKNKFEIQSSNMSIKGNQSVIYVDNTYKEYEGYGECLMTISRVSNVVIDGLKFDYRQTRRTACGKQFEISYARKITLKNCEFNIPETVIADETDPNIKEILSFCNGSLWTGWDDITITGCRFIQLADTNVGGCIGFNDYYGKGCSNLEFKGNVCNYAGHDECIAIFSHQNGTIKNINIENNYINALPSAGSIPRTMCFSIGYHDSNIENVNISKNIIKGYSDFALMTIGNAKNVRINNNNITYLKNSRYCYPVMFRTELKTYDNNIVIEKNEITVDQEITETSPGMGGLCEGKIKFYDNNINYNVYGYTLFSKDADVQRNTIYMSKGGNEIGAGIMNFINNKVVLNGKSQYLFIYQNKVLKDDVTIKGNEIFYNYEGGVWNENVLLITGVTLNDRSFVFSENRIKTVGNAFMKYLYSISIKDQTPQTIIITNNQTGNFKKTEVLKCDLSQHNVTIADND